MNKTLEAIAARANEQQAFLFRQHGGNIPEGFAANAYEFASHITFIADILKERADQSSRALCDCLSRVIERFPNAHDHSAAEYIRAELMMAASLEEV